MSVRRIGAHHTLPENPQWIEFPRTDGDKSQWPTNTTKIVDREGHVNYMRPVGIDESLSIHWRKQIGAAVAKALGKPDGPSYVLKSWPKEYALFDHNKGPEINPRHDAYLYGSTSVLKFRSTNEFIPHAIWLSTDPSLKRANCECKYCAKKPQKIVSGNLGLSARGGLSPSPSVVRPSKRQQRKPAPGTTTKKKPFTAVRQSFKPPKKLPGPKQFVVPERANDIHESLKKSDVFTPRLYRPEELLWCTINPPITSSSGRPDETIALWPGIVDDTSLKAVSIPIDPAPTDPDAPLWNVQQWTVHKVKLLGCDRFVSLTDKEVLPYLAYVPSQDLLQGVKNELPNLIADIPLEEMTEEHLEELYDFDPTDESLASDPNRYRKAVTPYTLAIQIASLLARFWTPTDDWEYKFTIPASLPENLPRPPSGQQPESLSEAISAAMASNAQKAVPPLPSQPPLASSDFSGPASLSPEELRSLRHDLLGANAAFSAVPRTVTQTRYQGLWWGAERIWTDELVRLKMSRGQFAPNGAPQVFPPSGPSAASIEKDQLLHGEGIDPKLLGAGQKGVFMKLDGLFIVDGQSPDGKMLKECRANGMLYELADDDWEEPPPSDVKGKGKERARDPVDEASSASVTAQDVLSQGQNSTGPDGRGGPSFMQGPSPLKPPPLPNPDPAVPSSETAADVLSQTTQVDTSVPQTNQPKSRTQISRPVLTLSKELPPAPKGHKFRPIVPEGHEVVISVSLISGRYYPGILDHPLLTDTFQSALAATRDLDAEPSPAFGYRHLWALEGLVPGAFQTMDPSEWKPDRSVMIAEAVAEAKLHFAESWREMRDKRAEWEQSQLQQAEEDPDAQGDVDMEQDLFAKGSSATVVA